MHSEEARGLRGLEPPLEPRTPTPDLRIFPNSGYAFLRAGTCNRQVQVVFDFGRFSRCPAPNHAHADALSFELYASGRALLVDPGVYLPWGDDGSWARYFRSSSAHNTLVVDGKDQSELSRYADVGRTASIRMIEYNASRGEIRVTGECIPCWSHRSEACHTRTISMRDDGRVFVRDRVSGSGRRRLEWFFHAAPGIHAVESGAGGFVLVSPESEKELAHLRPLTAQIPHLEIVRGQSTPRQGWASLNSAQVLPAHVAIFSTEADLPFSVDFELELSN